MSFDNIVINRVASHQRPELPEQEIDANIVFLNRTSHSIQPILFQLKDGLEPLADQSISDDTLTLVGTVTAIDKKEKKVFLDGNITVKYTYLITVSTPKKSNSSIDHDFSGGIHALVDALKMSENRKLHLPLIAPPMRKNQPFKAERMLKSPKKIQGPTFPKEWVEFSLITTLDKLYEIQL